MADLGTTATQTLMQTASDQASVGRIAQSADKLKSDKSVQAAQDFEAVFISEMIKPMFEMVEVDGVFGGGKGEEVFRGMMVQEYGKMIAAQGGIGIADQVRAELLRIQEHSAASQTETTTPPDATTNATGEAS